MRKGIHVCVARNEWVVLWAFTSNFNPREAIRPVRCNRQPTLMNAADWSNVKYLFDTAMEGHRKAAAARQGCKRARMATISMGFPENLTTQESNFHWPT